MAETSFVSSGFWVYASVTTANRMIRHIWTVYCREVVIDKETNNASMINALEELHFGAEIGDAVSEQARLVPFESTLITLWARREWDTPVTSTIRIRFIGPDRSELLNSTFVMNLEEAERTRAQLNFNVLGVKGSGCYEWVVERNGCDDEAEWVEEARIPVSIKTNWMSAGDDPADA